MAGVARCRHIPFRTDLVRMVVSSWRSTGFSFPVSKIENLGHREGPKISAGHEIYHLRFVDSAADTDATEPILPI